MSRSARGASDDSNMRRLRESERRFRAIFENVPDALLFVDESGDCIEANGASERLTGYIVGDLVGKGLTRKGIFLSSEIRRVEELIRKVYEGHITGPEDFRLRKADGRVIIVEVNGFPIELDGRAVAFYIRDVTELRRKTETERERTLKRLRKMLDETVSAIAVIGAMRDPYTAGHEERVAGLATAIAREMGVPGERVAGIKIAAFLHDAGKIVIPDEILCKPGRLNEHEWSILKTHPQVGYEILKGIDFPWPVARAVLEHQERLDGSGYPGGLKDGEIIEEARILMVADVVESMASRRPYRPAYKLEEALDWILKNRGTLFDKEVVDACLALFREKRYRLTGGGKAA